LKKKKTQNSNKTKTSWNELYLKGNELFSPVTKINFTKDEISTLSYNPYNYSKLSQTEKN